LCLKKKSRLGKGGLSRLFLPRRQFYHHTIMAPVTATIAPAAEREIDLTAGFGLSQIEPLMLEKHLTLNSVFPQEERGESAPWDRWSEYLKEQTYKAWEDLYASGDDLTEEQGDIYWNSRVLYAVTKLPKPVRDATHMMLFGHTTASPSYGALNAIRAALFSNWGDTSWLRGLYRKARHEHQEQQRRIDQLNTLVAVLEE